MEGKLDSCWRCAFVGSAGVEEFFQKCDPEKENLWLYGYPSEQREVNLPAEEVPPELPEPALGINFARDGMQEKDCLSLVAIHSDAWLLAVAFYFGARFEFDTSDRKRLFNVINELLTIYEVVAGTAKKQVKEKPSNMNSSGKSKSNSRKGRESQAKYSKVAEPKDEDEEGLEEEDEHGDSFVGHVERTTRLMSSGYAATSARNGSMVSASRSPLPGPSTLSNTNARLAATKERNPDGFRWAPSIRKQIFVLLTTRDCLS
ncbi:hypothetical protein MLD38_014707 [Melastoma candidum]|uniref:Uncharacterized protein n=1 Tax=Melastoma candidum TaxID=119954 RepID=A0ACB9RDJ4_9MYRT|nr:hypothetical protein MLD38_014707 [Melastoma candidum]